MTKNRPHVTENRTVTRATLAAIAVATVLTMSAVAGPAAAVEYPSWAQVESARSSEAGKSAQIGQLQSLTSGLTREVDTARAESDRRSREYADAQTTFDAASLRAMDLRVQADEAAATAEKSHVQAGRVAAMLARTGDSDLSLTLFLDGNEADDLLDQLGSMSKLTERASIIYETAAADRNAAESLTEQAERAKELLGDLAQDSERALADAIASTDRVENALAEQQRREGTLQAQLAVLTEDRVATEADFTKGEEVRIAAEATAEAARAAQSAAAAAAAASTGGSETPVAANNPTLRVPGDQGWALPVSGRISSVYGPRPDRPVDGVGSFHYGTDIAAGCGQGVYAAANGTVVYSGWLGSYGNWVLIDHGDGTQTGYAHNSQNLVSRGQQVTAGSTIALVGTTGASTGCHVHFETRDDGARVNPQPFMSSRGVTLG